MSAGEQVVAAHPHHCRLCLDCKGLGGLCTTPGCFCHHPDENTVQAYVSGRCSEAEIAETERHLDKCSSCLDLVVLAAKVPDEGGAA